MYFFLLVHINDILYLHIIFFYEVFHSFLGGHGIGVLGLEEYGKKQRTMPIIHGHAGNVDCLELPNTINL